MSNQLSVGVNNHVTVLDPNTGAPKLKVTLAGNGKFTGSWVQASETRPTPFSGVIFQKTVMGSGYFLHTGTGSTRESGAVTISVP